MSPNCNFVFLLVLGLLSSSLAMAGNFTPEQINEIRELVKEELRAEVEAQVRDELECDLASLDQATTSKPLNTGEVFARNSSDSAALIDNHPSYRYAAPVPLASERFLGAAAAAPMEFLGTSARSGFQLSAGTDVKRASIRLGRERSLPWSNGGAAFDSIAVTASAPLGKPDGGLINLATLDGFMNSTELAFTYSRWNVEGMRNPTLVGTDRLAQRDAICALAGIKTDQPCDFESVEQGLRNAGQEYLYPAYRALYWDQDETSRWTYGTTVRVGREVFDYFQPNLEKAKETEIPWGAKVYLGFVPRGTEAFIAFGAEWQQSYQADPPQTACTNSSDPILTCATGSLAAPSSKIKHIFTVEARGELLGVGMALKMSHDRRNDESGVDLPIYFIRNGGGQISGGIRAGWTSTDDFNFGVFVGTPLAILR